MRLDFGFVHAREARGARERWILGRTLLYLQRGTRPLFAHQARGMEGVSLTGNDNRPSRRQRWYAAQDVGSGRLYTNATCTQALLARPSPRLHRGAWVWLRNSSTGACT